MMFKYKALFLALLSLSSLSLSFNARADEGPYYIYYEGFCNIVRLYITPLGYFYGREVGCAEDDSVYTGISQGNQAILSYHYFGDSRLQVFDLTDNSITTYESDGNSLYFFAEGTWRYNLSLEEDEFARHARKALPSIND